MKIEGLINETLLPAVFFENYEFLEGWKASFKSIGEFVTGLIVEIQAVDDTARISTLNHFLAVTSRDCLQRVKWSVESVRRALLDEMMGVLHRQSRLTQLGIGSIERTPEQAVGANESQLRGYVMLTAAKMPLISNVLRYAEATLEKIFNPSESCEKNQLVELNQQLAEWRRLVEALEENIHGLEKAIEHAWMERMLYEQEQVRAEQEAMAEIERSRNSRRPLVSSGSIVNVGLLFFTVIAAVWAIDTTGPAGSHPKFGSTLLITGVVGLTALMVALLSPLIIRWRQDRRNDAGIYEYEFAFRLDKKVDPDLALAYLEEGRVLREEVTGLPGFSVSRRGGVRIERISTASTLVKLHSSLSFRDGRFQRAQFEVVTEILAHKVSDENQYMLREARIFGASQKALPPEEVVNLIQVALNVTASRLLEDGLNADEVIALALPIFKKRAKASPKNRMEGLPSRRNVGLNSTQTTKVLG